MPASTGQGSLWQKLARWLDALFLLALASTTILLDFSRLPSPTLKLLRLLLLLYLGTIFVLTRLPLIFLTSLKELLLASHGRQRVWRIRRSVFLKTPLFALTALFIFYTFQPHSLRRSRGQEASPSASLVTEATPSAALATEATPSATLASLLLEASPSAEITAQLAQRKPTLLKRTFRAQEEVAAFVGTHRLGSLKTTVIGPDGSQAEVNTQLEGEVLKIKPLRQFRPGKYHLKVTDEDLVVLEQDFSWGVLAINTHKSIYLPNETANLAIAVLDETGKMVCDAKLNLTIKEDSQDIHDELTTENGKISVRPACRLHDFTLEPDYEAQYQVKGPGKYEMILTAQTPNGSFTISDSFEVRETVRFDVARETATRLYPIKTYPVTFNLKAFEDFAGEVEEIVPQDFQIFPATNDRSYDKVKEQGGEKIIVWKLSLKKGETISLGYKFDPPDTSPYLYLLGKLKLKDQNSALVFEEARHWQLAIDVPSVIILNFSNTILTSGTTWTVPADWTDDNNTIEVIGGGGAGQTDTGGITGAGGGGGGGYAKSVNVDLTPGAAVIYQIGVGGHALSKNGTDTFFNGSGTTCANSSPSVCAKGGLGATSVTGALGGEQTGNTGSVGSTINAGGSGGTGHTTGDTSGGGGGAGSKYGAGGTGGNGAQAAAAGSQSGGGGGGGGSTACAGSPCDGGVGAATGGAGGASWHTGDGGTGGTTGVDGTNGTTGGGGGGGGDGAGDGGNGGNGDEWTTAGAGGGGAGSGDTATTTGMAGQGGLYGAGGGGGRYGGRGAPGVIVITYNGKTPTQTSWTVPSDWNDSDNSLEVIGGGGAGRWAAQGAGAGGGGAGAYSKTTTLDLTPGNTITYQIGQGGRKTTIGANNGVAGTDTFFNGSGTTCADSSPSVCAKGGAAANGATAGAGGASGSGVGSTVFSGGNGGNGNGTGDSGGGGGGAASPDTPDGNGEIGGAGSGTASEGGGGGGGAGGDSSSVGAAGGVTGTEGGNGGNGPAGTGGGAGGNPGNGTAGTAGTGGGGGGGSSTLSGADGGTGSAWTSTGAGGGGGGSGDNNAAATTVCRGGDGGFGGGGGGGGLMGGFGAEGIVVITYTPVTITVSGNVYSAAGGTETVCSGASELRLRVGFSAYTTYTASCADSTGTFSFTGVTPPVAGDGMVIWIEGQATDGALVIRYDGSGDSTSNNLYESTVTVTSDDTNPVDILDMDVYDYGNDSDIPYTATDGSPDTLSVSSNFNLRVSLKSGVASGSTVFDPGGTVTTQGTGSLHVDDNAVAYLDTATNTIAANVLVDDGGKINFDADTTINGGFITVTSGGDVASAAGAVTMGASGTIGGGSTGSIFQLTNLIVSAGTTTLGADGDNILAFTGDISVSSGATLAMNGKTVDIDGGNLTTTGTGSITCTSCSSGGVTISGDGLTNGIGGGSGAIALYSLTLDGTTNTTAIGTSPITILDDVTIGSDRTLSSYSSGTIYVADDWSNSGIFTANSGTVNFNGGDSTTQALSGNTTFYNFTASTASNSAGRTFQFAGNSETIVSGTWTITGYSGKVITLQSSDTNNWTVNPTTANVTYVDVYRSTNTGTSFCATYSTKDANCVGWSVGAGASCNQNPNSPSSLAQKKTDETVLAVGDWTNETSVKFTATASDTDNPDTLYLCVEKDDINTAFSDTEDSCGTGVAYSGSPVTVSVTISSITDATQYHWHARVKDAASAYSSWVAYGGNSDTTPGADRDFGVDTTDPTGGTIYDGTETGVDQDFSTTSLSQLSANWDSFDATVSGLNKYQYSIGTTQGGTDIKAWTDNSTTTSVTASSLTLQTSQVYYFNVRTVDNAGNTQDPVISSDGQVITPSLSFSVSPSTLPFANLNEVNSYTDTEDATLTTSTNAYNGYVIRAFITDYPRSTDGNDYTIIDFNGGSYASPDEWLSSDRGFGYTSSDPLVQEVNKFGISPCPGGGAPPCYAPFNHTGPGDIIADHTATVSGDPITGEVFTITCKVMADSTKEAANYVTTIVYTITAQY